MTNSKEDSTIHISIQQIGNYYQLVLIDGRKREVISEPMASVENAIEAASAYLQKVSGGEPVSMTDPWGEAWNLGGKH